MIRPSQQTIHCIGCEYACQIYPEEAIRSQYCGQSSFAIWPEGNVYLRDGLLKKILLESNNRLSRGFLFVDFSLPWLREFTDPLWVERLLNTRLRIVIVADKHLVPLANYWLTKSNKIHGILYANDDDETLRIKVRRLFTGHLAVNRQGAMLNFTEYILLSRYVSGKCTQNIIGIDNIDSKKIYIHKFRLEKKLGFTIQKIISRIL